MKVMVISHSRVRAMTLWVAVMWIAAALLAAVPLRADIYTWEDADGVIHFSNQDAPPNAEIYMQTPTYVEPEPAASEPAVAPQTRVQEDTAARLDAAGRKLDQALDKVEDLEKLLSDSQSEAADLAAAAQQAALSAEQHADEAAQYSQKQKRVNDRVIVYGTPYPYRFKKDGYKRRAPYYSTSPKKHHRKYKSDRFKKHKYRHLNKDKTKKYKYKTNQYKPKNPRLHYRHNSKLDTRPGWISPTRPYGYGAKNRNERLRY